LNTIYNHLCASISFSSTWLVFWLPFSIAIAEEKKEMVKLQVQVDKKLGCSKGQCRIQLIDVKGFGHFQLLAN